MKVNKKIIVTVGFVTLLVAVILVFISGGQEVTAVRAEKGIISKYVEDTAIVKAADDKQLYAAQNSKVMEVYVEVGQTVSSGQLLLKLENPDLDLQLTEARTSLAQAKSTAASTQAAVKQLELALTDAKADFERINTLFTQGAVSQSEYEKASLLASSTESSWNQQKALLDSAQSAINGASTLLQQLEERSKELDILSPIDGTILELPVKFAQPVIPGTLLISVGSPDNLEIQADILSDDLADIKLGQKVIVTAPILGEDQLQGTVEKIYPQAEEQMSALGVIQRRVPVIIRIDEKANLQPGYEVRVAIETIHLDNVLVLPIESVRSLSGQQKQLILIDGDRAVYRNIETGLSDNNYIQIIGGLDEGSLVVQDANIDIKDNTRVKVIN